MEELVKERITLIRNSVFANHKFHKYSNSTQLSGFIIQKPIFTTTTGGKEVVRFIVWQVHERTYETYSCQAFSKKVIETLKTLNNVGGIACIGRVVYIAKLKVYTIQVEEIAITHEYTDTELAPSYVAKG